MTLPLYLAYVAWKYESAEHMPTNAGVEVAYAAFTTELWQQFLRLSADTHFMFTRFDPYANSREMFADMDRGQLRVYANNDGLPMDHPLRAHAPNGEMFNSIFRAVHDALAHYPERNSFSARGELAAFRAHARTLTPLAIRALFTETVAQNAYYNYGLHARTFAPQKAVLLPLYLIDDALTLEV